MKSTPVNGRRLRSTREVIVKSDRFVEAKTFYEDVLGFMRILDEDRIAGFETGSFALYVEPGTPDGPVFEIECDDVAETAARLVRAGCTVIEEDSSIPRLYLRDPFGLTFNLREGK